MTDKEIDVLMAERVMGYEIFPWDTDEKPDPPYVSTPWNAEQSLTLTLSRQEFTRYSTTWEPSKRHDQAMECRAKAIEKVGAGAFYLALCGVLFMDPDVFTTFVNWEFTAKHLNFLNTATPRQIVDAVALCLGENSDV